MVKMLISQYLGQLFWSSDIIGATPYMYAGEDILLQLLNCFF